MTLSDSSINAGDSKGQAAHPQLNLLDLSQHAVPGQKARDEQEVVHCHATDDQKLLSMVGPILSFEQHNFTTCDKEAHPSGQTNFDAIDLRAYNDAMEANEKISPSHASLDNYFDPDDVFDALIQDKVVQKALGSIQAHPKNLDGLLKAIDTGLTYLDPQPDSSTDGTSTKFPLCFTMEKDMLNHFAFDHVEGDKVAVRIGLPGAGPCRENLTQIGILLPIPSYLKEAIKGADAGTNGFMMKDAKKKGIHTKLDYEYTDIY